MNQGRPRRRESPVPAALLALYEHRNNLKPHELGRNHQERTESIALLCRLINDSDLKIAWPRLSRYTRVLSRRRADYYAIEVFNTCLCSIHEWRRLPKDSAKTLPKIARAALKLMRLLQKSVYLQNCSIDRFMDRIQLAELGKNVSGPPALKEPLEDEFKGQILLMTFAPDVSMVLQQVAADAMSLAKQPKAVRQSGSRRAMAHFLALDLSRRFRRDLGKPLHGLVAKITNAAVEGSALDSDSVRKLTRDLNLHRY